MPDTLLVDGTDLRTIMDKVLVWDDMTAIAPRRGSNVEIPHRDGEVHTPKRARAGVQSVTGQLTGGTEALLNDKFRALKLLCRPGRLLALSRTVTFTTGVETQTASGEYGSGLRLAHLGAASLGIARLTLSFNITSGLWHRTTVAVVAPGTVTVQGDTDTRRMTLVFPGAGTLTNTTTGVSVTVAVATTLDVDAFTATAGTVALPHAGDTSWMVLAPGSNTLTWSGAGTVTINYLPAFL